VRPPRRSGVSAAVGRMSTLRFRQKEVGHALGQDATEMPLVERNHPIEALASRGSKAARIPYVPGYCTYGTYPRPVAYGVDQTRALSGAHDKFRNAKEEPPSIICVGCEQRVPLWDEMEQCFASPEIQQKVRNMQEEAKIVLDNESKERVLVGEVISTVALAGQISREFNVSDHGIDMEIEFKDDANEATGAKVYLQLKSGDSYLHKRISTGEEVFTIRDERHARYWSAQAFPVLLLIRSSGGEVRWMDVWELLRRTGALVS
jgi:hypothetical protein